MNISDIGEFGLIDIIKKMANREIDGGIGDDCAIIDIDSRRDILVTTDTLVEGVHFFKDAEAYVLGRKSIAVSISDIAAMAAYPKWAFLSISLSDKMSLEYVQSFARGFCSMADEFGIALMGGDTTKSPVFTVTVTLIGENRKGESIKRSGAKTGDNVYVTGKIGCSYAGFEAIRRNLKGFEKLKKMHTDPYPKIKEALKVKKYATAMIDISDGLLQDCLHICEQSGVAIEVDFDKIPFCKADFVKKEDMITGGEDYELVFCAPKRYESVLDGFENITKIGVVREGFGVSVIKNNEKLNFKRLGFKHF